MVLCGLCVERDRETERERARFRPVLTVAQYDTLNYTTPLKDLFRVSYLGNVRTGLYNEEGRKEGELCAIFFPN